MDFIKVVAVFAVFILGLVFAIQGFVGREIYPEGRPFGFAPDQNDPGMQHPPERHPVRLFFIGLGLMVAAVILGLIIL